MATLKEELAQLVKVEGISAAVVISRDGFVVDGVNNSGTFDQEAVGAVVSAGIGSLEAIGRELNAGGLAEVLIECADGIVATRLLGADTALTVVTDAKANVGNVRYQIKKQIPAILAAL